MVDLVYLPKEKKNDEFVLTKNLDEAQRYLFFLVVKVVEGKSNPFNRTMSVSERAQDILAARRSKIDLLRHPATTISLFTTLVLKKASFAAVDTIRHPTFRYIVVPLIAIATFISFVVVEQKEDRLFRELDVDGNNLLSAAELRAGFGSGIAEGTQLTKAAFVEFLTSAAVHHKVSASLDHGAWREVEYLLADAIWWLVLGILSSVGLGSGMHSGLLFLFPHIYLTCMAADACGDVSFWTYPTNIFYGPKERVFHCINEPSSTTTVSLWLRVWKVLPWCILWGAGTAIGEIPPYALSYAAALQGKKQDELEEVSKFDVLNRMKDWMLDKIQKYGFWAILLLAAWPNMAFDLCGMACGQFLTPFWVFFGATFVGKALIKVNGQAVFFVALFSGDNIERFLQWVFHGIEVIIPADFVVKGLEKGLDVIRKTRHEISQRALGNGGSSDESEGSIAAKAMGWIVIAAVAWFAKSIVDTFAQSQQESYDEERLAELQSAFARKKVWSDEEIEALLDDTSSSNSVATLHDVAVWSVVAPLVASAGAVFYGASLQTWAIGCGALTHLLFTRLLSSGRVEGAWTTTALLVLRVSLVLHVLFAAYKIAKGG